MEAIGGFGGLALLILAYCLPMLVAVLRNHRNMAAITALNLLLGWTVLGWIGSFVWSLTANTEQKA